MKKSDIHRRQIKALAKKWFNEAVELVRYGDAHEAARILKCRRELLALGDSVCGGM